MNSDEQRGYSRGYAAGRRRAKLERQEGARLKERQAFLDKAFLAAVPAAINSQNWTRGKEPITSLKDRVALARDIADEALKQRKIL